MTTTLRFPRPAEGNYGIDYDRSGWQDSREALEVYFPRPAEEDYGIDYDSSGWQDSREALEFYYDSKAYGCIQKMGASGQSLPMIARTLQSFAKDYNRNGYVIAGDCYERAANAVLKLSRPRRRKRH